MDIGSGLTLQTRTVNGKLTTGVFFGNERGKAKPKFPVRSVIDSSENPKIEETKKENVKNLVKNPKSFDNRQNKLKKNQSTKNTATTVPRKERIVPADRKEDSHPGNGQKSQPTDSKATVKNGAKKLRTVNNNRKQTVARVQHENETTESDTKYVTLTQGQLSTILSLVKSKNEVDVSKVLREEEGGKVNKEEGEKSEVDKKKETAEKEMPEGEKKIKTSRPGSRKLDSQENIANLLKNEKESVQDGEKMVEHSLEREKSDSSLSQDLPAAIRSSFFLGEAAPREHAFSAKKRAAQQQWREELDKQRLEQREKKEQEKSSRMKLEEQDSWSRHFDTMLPTKNVANLHENHVEVNERKHSIDDSVGQRSEQKNGNNSNNVSVDHHTGSAEVTKNPENLRNSFESGDLAAGDFASTFSSNAIPQRSTYLRTMTSLLDPAQIEALDLKRRKQEEHRRAIEAQVQERKQKKEEEEKRHRQMEAEEDRRLAEERDSFAQKNETEKLRQQMQENMREKKTRELYQQMKNAEESALRDKLSKREQSLKNKGHDTSRLERAHQMALEMTHKVSVEQPLAETSYTSIAGNVHSYSGVLAPQPLQDGYMSNNLTPRQVISVGDQTTPIALTAQTEQGPIKFEISVNPRRSADLVESAVQTDEDNLNFYRGVIDSDNETEYLRLPPKTRNVTQKERKNKNSRLQTFERNLDRQYDKHSRTDRNVVAAPPRRKKNERRPKWGVGEKNKTFVPATQRYTYEQQRHDAGFRRREERHVVSDPEGISRPPARNLPNHYRAKSPVTTVIKNQHKETSKRLANPKPMDQRPVSGIYATTDQAKYRSEKHSRDSPVPETKDFVQYRRTTAVLDPSLPQSRPETGPMESRTEFVAKQDRPLPVAVGDGSDPLLNPNLVRQHDRQEQILKEISILRQGLLIKQREIASYPAAMTMLPPSGIPPTNLVLAGGGNLPERTNDTPIL